MENVTITLDDETARWARLEAARNDDYERAEGSYRQHRARALSADDRGYPDRDEIHSR